MTRLMTSSRTSGALEHRTEILARQSRTSRPYVVLNPDGPVAELRIYDEIWFFGVNADDFARDLEAITAPEILVAINSPGGDVFDAIAIYNALRAHPARVTTRVDGIAASAASIIAQAGAHRIMMSGSQMMIHEPWGLAIGPATEIREFADLLDLQAENLAKIYASRSGRDPQDFRDMMSSGKDVYLSAEETVAEGLADEVSDPTANQATPVAASTRNLIDEIRDAAGAALHAADSAERVAALRASKGKDLSKVNVEGLAGLKDGTRSLERMTQELSRLSL